MECVAISDDEVLQSRFKPVKGLICTSKRIYYKLVSSQCYPTPFESTYWYRTHVFINRKISWIGFTNNLRIGSWGHYTTRPQVLSVGQNSS